MINKDICEELDNLVREDDCIEIRLKKRNSDLYFLYYSFQC